LAQGFEQRWIVGLIGKDVFSFQSGAPNVYSLFPNALIVGENVSR
jgi:hypothetical protein